MHTSEHSFSAVISKHSGEPLSITGPSPYTETTFPLPAYAGLLQTTSGWWGIVVHCPSGTHPQTAIQHFESIEQPVIWCGQGSTIGLYLLPTGLRVTSARINDTSADMMKKILGEQSTTDWAESRLDRRRVPASIRYLPNQTLQMWFSL